MNRPELHEAAQAYFKRAIELDPGYAPAYAGLADFYRSLAMAKDEESQQAWPLAEQYAHQALLLDPENAETHIAIAQIKLLHDWDWPAAREHALRALKLNPSLPDAHVIYARYLRVAGNISEDLKQREMALAIDPDRMDLKHQLALERYFSRDYQTLVTYSRQVLTTDPNDLAAHSDLCIDLGHLHVLEEAATECSKELTLKGQADWARMYLQEYGRNGYEAAQLFVAKKRLQEVLKQRHPNLWDLANAYVAAGMRDETLRCLYQGLPAHEPGLLQLRVDPDFDPVRDDRRFTDLIRQIGFPSE
jgi:tetratricopeptide (TPR) repeat protein